MKKVKYWLLSFGANALTVLVSLLFLIGVYDNSLVLGIAAICGFILVSLAGSIAVIRYIHKKTSKLWNAFLVHLITGGIILAMAFTVTIIFGVLSSDGFGFLILGVLLLPGAFANIGATMLVSIILKIIMVVSAKKEKRTP